MGNGSVPAPLIPPTSTNPQVLMIQGGELVSKTDCVEFNSLRACQIKENVMAGVQEVVAVIAADQALSKGAAREVLDAVLSTITHLTADGDSVMIRGFGTFKLKTTKARVGRNPQTNEPLNIPAKTKLTFKASK